MQLTEKQAIGKFICAVFNKKFIFKIYFGAGEMAHHVRALEFRFPDPSKIYLRKCL